MLHLEKLYARETYLLLFPSPPWSFRPTVAMGSSGALLAVIATSLCGNGWGSDVPEGAVWQREWGPDVPEGAGGDGGLQVLVHCGGHAHELGADEIGGALYFEVLGESMMTLVSIVPANLCVPQRRRLHQRARRRLRRELQRATSCPRRCL